ncbi:MAG: tRNA threonylcarbamoyladenosine dehydratase [Bacteroidales bacterium]|jgi:tRNA A37 threonylcarbamoyladenosine dehydratase|nr:tRNA threonylcarbamoyladenosine dehydratase [Bacteroidales bacterium]MBQ6101265.1 tRNA threonylcarbamoyladenosine dehydratase [Bacteroidales bacterium]MBR6848525.1 tRNA threonylcarbamoyladenosine dehydratase [Bacteroidales bacterium]
MEQWNDRTRLLIGDDGIDKLKNSHVLVVGLGGVGAYAAEQLARAGIGRMTIVDGDVVNITNRNRQLLALGSTQGRPKAEVMAERIRDINPDVELEVINQYMKDDAIIELVSKPYDYVVDAIDTVAPKVFLLYYAKQNNQRIVSCMGAGGKFHPEKIEIADIAQSNHCRLAFYIRKRLHRLGVFDGIKAVFSPEPVDESAIVNVSEQNKVSNVGTISYMPAAFGIFCASVVINDLLGHSL